METKWGLFTGVEVANEERMGRREAAWWRERELEAWPMEENEKKSERTWPN